MLYRNYGNKIVLLRWYKQYLIYNKEHTLNNYLDVDWPICNNFCNFIWLRV